MVLLSYSLFLPASVIRKVGRPWWAERLFGKVGEGAWWGSYAILFKPALWLAHGLSGYYSATALVHLAPQEASVACIRIDGA